MHRFIRITLAGVVAVTLLGPSSAGAQGSGDAEAAVAARAEALASAGAPMVAGPATEALARNPWSKVDAVGDAARPGGDVTRIAVKNGRRSVQFTFRMADAPTWDDAGVDRVSTMSFLIDRRRTSPAFDRQVIVFKEDGVWFIGVLNRQFDVVCARQGGVNILANRGFRIAVPVNLCLGGPRAIRVNGGFVDDLDDTAVEDLVVDEVPDGRYGPFIRLPRG